MTGRVEVQVAGQVERRTGGGRGAKGGQRADQGEAVPPGELTQPLIGPVEVEIGRLVFRVGERVRQGGRLNGL